MPTSREQMDTEQKVTELLAEAGFHGVESERFPIVEAVEPDRFMARRTQLGIAAARFRSLSPSDQATCLGHTRSRLDDLTADQLTSRDFAILTWARAATS
jgi:hypothetical protein